MTTANILSQLGSAGVSTAFKNRIINGAMVIDQRNAGASVTATAISAQTYTIDRWAYQASAASKFTVQQNAGSVTPPVGFVNYLGMTSSSPYSVGSGDFFFMDQPIEGSNMADLAWGTANAKTITISFWVRSSLTGTFGGALNNNGYSRSYPYTYTINSANTWEQKSITITGCTDGTWITNSTGYFLWLTFGLGVGSTYSGTSGSWANSAYFTATGATSVVGTNGATFYITGVQLEVGTTATNFDYRPYGTELALCQRYFQTSYNTGVAVGTASFNGCSYWTNNGSDPRATDYFCVFMRTSPTITYYSPNTGAAGKIYNQNGNNDVNANAGVFPGTRAFITDIGVVTSGRIAGYQWTSSAEL
jgi:hypothetical protein